MTLIYMQSTSYYQVTTKNNYQLLERKRISATEIMAVLQILCIITSVLAPILYCLEPVGEDNSYDVDDKENSNEFQSFDDETSNLWVFLMLLIVAIYVPFFISSVMTFVTCITKSNHHISDNFILASCAVNVLCGLIATIFQATPLVRANDKFSYAFWFFYIPVLTLTSCLLFIQFLGPLGALLSLSIILAGSYGSIPSSRRRISNILLITYTLTIIAFTIYMKIKDSTLYIFYEESPLNQIN